MNNYFDPNVFKGQPIYSNENIPNALNNNYDIKYTNYNKGKKINIYASFSNINEIKEFKPANLLFLYCYYELYLQDKSKENLNRVNYYLERVEKNSNNKEIKEIEAELKKIHSSIKIEL